MKKLKKERKIKYYSAEETVKLKVKFENRINKLQVKHGKLTKAIDEKLARVKPESRREDGNIFSRIMRRITEFINGRRQKRAVTLSLKATKTEVKIARLEENLKLIEQGKLEKLPLHKKLQQSFSYIGYRKQTMIWGLIFILPWLFGMLILFLPSMIDNLMWSFSNTTLTPDGMELEYVGFDKFIYLFKDYIVDGSIFSVSLLDFMQGLVIDLPVIIIFSILMAVLLNKPFKGHRIVKAIFFIPVVYNLAVITETLTGTFGQHFAETMQEDVMFVNQVTGFFMDIGIADSLLTVVLGAVQRIFMIVNLSGIQILIFVAAIQAIPSQLYEVAEIEGATKYEMFWKITIPMIMPMVLTAAIYTIVDSFSRTPILRFLRAAVAVSDYGLGAAISISYFIINLALVGLIFLLFKGRVFYYDKEK
ncbi:MAG TPA: sugar ABC transporter permease [Acholeplasmataceae bacterium]|nr:sugar ABC transporter permease [Acholeplasmataceae bacterium]HQC30291.1 sugar ABC transporter permease [Acholeplasmataceae bacterium]